MTRETSLASAPESDNKVAERVDRISIHRWQDDTLHVLLADHLHPERSRLEAELADLAESRTGGDSRSQAHAQRRYDEIQTQLQELYDLLATVEQIAERGAPPTDARCQKREADAPFRMDLDDGVMINSAALWPLLAPHGWKDPAKWWAELCNAKEKDYDLSHLALLPPPLSTQVPARPLPRHRPRPLLALPHRKGLPVGTPPPSPR